VIVVMTRQRTWQHVGREKALSVGEVYDLPDGVALALVASGAADRVTTDAPAERREMAVTAPAETGRRRSRA
jgi:hypothetical protein